MPMIDLYAPQDALPEADLAALAGRIADTVNAEEGYAGSRFAANVTWTYIHEVPAGRLIVGAEPARKAVWRLEVTSPAGSLDAAAKARLGREVAHLVLEATGEGCDSARASRVWCLFHDVVEGEWFAGARAVSVGLVRDAVARERNAAVA